LRIRRLVCVQPHLKIPLLLGIFISLTFSINSSSILGFPILSPRIHKEITEEALKPLGFSDKALEHIIDGVRDPDQETLLRYDPAVDSKWHFDNCAFKEGKKAIEKLRKEIVDGLFQVYINFDAEPDHHDLLKKILEKIRPLVTRCPRLLCTFKLDRRASYTKWEVAKS